MNERKKQISDAALTLFQEKGLPHTSIQDILVAANISKGTFYNHFSSKNDCVAEILENLREEANQLRITAQIGKNKQDRTIFIEQISILIRLQEERKLYRLFEAILHSNEADLKKLVLQHRIKDMEWLTARLIEVRGEDIRPYAFEGVVLFTGMLQHILFVNRYTNSSYELKEVIHVILSYLELILAKMSKDQTSLLQTEAIHQFRTQVNKKTVTLEDIHTHATIFEKERFSEEQQDLYDAIMTELKKERLRTSVLLPLLKPFQTTFKETPLEAEAQTFTNLIWFYLHSH
ncbi:TetR/AcrR family transcriptional regulator [Shouchella patagoniensis]|uniref:TetR/AcrR family transcriptional regulator n=1 Tax=Shouchella patagoniensis TaxID=228576 RepID=UPI000994C594|nr:TetR/AcrR family transcriptional regulator [Shouchella patagoniensis]